MIAVDIKGDLWYHKVMRSNYYNDLEVNQAIVSLASFMESYNKSAPSHLPAASLKTLKQFQEAYPALFRKEDEWSIDKHRKKFMDWTVSNKKSA
jgi:hypothetical protein